MHKTEQVTGVVYCNLIWKLLKQLFPVKIEYGRVTGALALFSMALRGPVMVQ